MYPSSTTSSSQGSLGQNGAGGGTGSGTTGLFRYGSAPSSLLASAVDSIMNPTPAAAVPVLGSTHHHQPHAGPTQAPPPPPRLFFPPPSEASSSQLTSESTSKTSYTTNNNSIHGGGLRRAYDFKHEGRNMGGGGEGTVSSSAAADVAPPPLVRHSSSPAGFLNQLARACTSNDDSGFSNARSRGISRLNSQLSFVRQETLSQISEESEDVANGLRAEDGKRKAAHSYDIGSYGGGSWEDAHTIMFSVGPSKRSKNASSEMISGLSSMESQFQFGMPQSMLEMASMEKMLNIPEDSVPCKISAKRGCATHPRSIAERERRTRISGKLKKLQDLVPNMDKQTSYADMLDLAVQHIKGLQHKVQKLNKELENCTCGCRKPRYATGEEKS